ncbi:MAG: D-sedoheptulose 7-phosphate isomerase [Treponemataceae bacterium]|nr:MAG: D-sedoheptulose 7-phosphate isomerase [Treponemataceae bacterium]
MDYLQHLTERYPTLLPCSNDILAVYNILESCFSAGNKLLLCGNGGSASDASHITGELMKSFVKKRIPPNGYLEGLMGALPAINLCEMLSLNTAILNDNVQGAELVYAQGVYALGKKDDVLFAISTSGNSPNVCNAAITAKKKGVKTVALTGSTGGKLATLCDAAIIVPETETYKVQELHLPVYHALCLQLEEFFFE